MIWKLRPVFISGRGSKCWQPPCHRKVNGGTAACFLILLVDGYILPFSVAIAGELLINISHSFQHEHVSGAAQVKTWLFFKSRALNFSNWSIQMTLAEFYSDLHFAKPFILNRLHWQSKEFQSPRNLWPESTELMLSSYVIKRRPNVQPKVLKDCNLWYRDCYW